MTVKPHRIVLNFLSVTVWVALIFMVPLAVRIQNLGISGLPYDKLVHFLEYGILGFLFMRAVFFSSGRRDLNRAYLLTAGITLFIAASDEFHQIYVSERTASTGDLVADGLGIVASMLLFHWRIKRSGVT